MPNVRSLLAALLFLAAACADPAPGETIEPLVSYDTAYRIVSVDSGQCIDIWGSTVYAGAVLTQAPCHTGINQRWRLHHGQPFRPDGGVGSPGFTRIVSDLNPAYCIATNAARQLVLFRCGDVAAAWEILSFSVDPNAGPTNLVERIENRWNHRCIDVPGGTDAVGAGLQTYGCNGGFNQKWVFAPLP